MVQILLQDVPYVGTLPGGLGRHLEVDDLVQQLTEGTTSRLG